MFRSGLSLSSRVFLQRRPLLATLRIGVLLLFLCATGVQGQGFPRQIADLETAPVDFFPSESRAVGVVGDIALWVLNDIGSGPGLFKVSADGVEMLLDLGPRGDGCCFDSRLLGAAGSIAVVSFTFSSGAGDGTSIYRVNVATGEVTALGSQLGGWWLLGYDPSSDILGWATTDGDGSGSGTTTLWRSVAGGAAHSTETIGLPIIDVALTAGGSALLALGSSFDAELHRYALEDGSLSRVANVEGLFSFSGTMGSVTFFSAYQDFEPALWVSDGTAAGTRVIHPSDYEQLYLGESVAWFTVSPTGGFEPPFDAYVSDGTTGGTRRVGRLQDNTYPVTVVGERLVLDHFGPGVHELSSISPTGVTSAHTVTCGADPPGGFAGLRSWVVESSKVFLAYEGCDTGSTLWVSDGTVAGTRDLASLIGDPFYIDSLFAGAGGVLVLLDRELHWTDGSSTRRLVEDVSMSSQDFQAGDDIASFTSFSLDLPNTLWVSDGTSAGTREVGSTRVPRSDSSMPRSWATGPNAVAFLVDVFPRLYTVDSSANLEAVDVDDEYPTAFGPMGWIGDRLLVPFSSSLVSIEGSEIETLLGQSVRSGDFGRPSNRVVFFTTEGLWGSNGRASGTRLLASIGAPHLDDERRFSVPLQTGEVVVFGQDSSFRDVFYATDGTPSGTRFLFDADGVQTWTVIGNSVVAISRDAEVLAGPIAGGGLDGVTSLGTWVDLPKEMITVGQRAYFTFDDGLKGRELWVTDGSLEGTGRVMDIWPGRGSSNPRELIAAPSGLVFVADHPTHGTELWWSNGTEAGTRLLVDLWPGPGSARPVALSIDGDRLFLSANDGEKGWEPAMFDLGEQRLTWLGDIDPGPASSEPEHFSLLGDLLYFAADGGIDGREPWLIDLAADGGESCVADNETLCLLDGRFEVKARFRNPNTFESGSARSEPFPGLDRTGSFWFFKPDNIELVVKALDGRGVNGSFWFYYGALSDVEYWIDVRDTATNRTRTYYNPRGEFCGYGDTRAFVIEQLSSSRPPVEKGASDCTVSESTACLQGGRFAVEVEWQTSKDSGVGTVVSSATAPGDGSETAFFWFFSPSNIELAVKVLDGTPVNGHFWTFFGALSDVAYQIEVTDTTTGASRLYPNPQGTLCGQRDVEAFPD